MSDASSPQPTEAERTLSRKFVLRTLFVLGIIALGYMLVQLSTIIIMAAGSIIVAVIIHLIADPLHKHFNVEKRLAVLIGIASIAILLLGFGWLFGSQIAAQSNTFLDELPRSAEQLRQSMSGTTIGDMALQAWDGAGEQAGAVFGYVRGLVGNVLNALIALVVIIVTGIILATQPITYRDGILLLVPSRQRGRLRSVMNASGRSLKGWMIGQLIAMSIIGILVSLGLLLIGVPSWLILGLLAGFAQFVPLVGPIASAVPGLIIAGSMGWGPLLWTFLVYVGVQQLESNFITPYVMKRMTALPMVVTLFSILAFSTLFGPIGVVFATPITVILYVAIQMLYVEDQLGEKISVKGEKSHSAAAGH